MVSDKDYDFIYLPALKKRRPERKTRLDERLDNLERRLNE
jgi:hypothetical protein